MHRFNSRFYKKIPRNPLVFRDFCFLSLGPLSGVVFVWISGVVCVWINGVVFYWVFHSINNRQDFGSCIPVEEVPECPIPKPFPFVVVSFNALTITYLVSFFLLGVCSGYAVSWTESNQFIKRAHPSSVAPQWGTAD